MKKHTLKKIAPKANPLAVGDAVTLIDESGNEHDALVKIIGAPDSIHVIYLDEHGNLQEVHSVGLKATDSNKAHIER